MSTSTAKLILITGYSTDKLVLANNMITLYSNAGKTAYCLVQREFCSIRGNNLIKLDCEIAKLLACGDYSYVVVVLNENADECFLSSEVFYNIKTKVSDSYSLDTGCQGCC